MIFDIQYLIRADNSHEEINRRLSRVKYVYSQTFQSHEKYESRKFVIIKKKKKKKKECIHH